MCPPTTPGWSPSSSTRRSTASTSRTAPSRWELAGEPAPGAGQGARGFVGIAFRLQKEKEAYDAFYLRPTNGRADDQERRNHATQYIAHPDWPWFRLRKETPSRYESYVDLVPGEWTKIRIEVTGDRARLYVHETSSRS